MFPLLFPLGHGSAHRAEQVAHALVAKWLLFLVPWHLGGLWMVVAGIDPQGQLDGMRRFLIMQHGWRKIRVEPELGQKLGQPADVEEVGRCRHGKDLLDREAGADEGQREFKGIGIQAAAHGDGCLPVTCAEIRAGGLASSRYADPGARRRVRVRALHTAW